METKLYNNKKYLMIPCMAMEKIMSTIMNANKGNADLLKKLNKLVFTILDRGNIHYDSKKNDCYLVDQKELSALKSINERII